MINESQDNTSGAREPVRYIAREKSSIGNEIIEQGQPCMYAGLPAENLEPTCDVGRARYQEYLESNKARIEAQIRDNQGPGALDPIKFMENMIKVQAEMAAEQAEKQTAAIAGAVAQAVAAALGQMFPNGAAVAAPVPAGAASTVDTTKAEADVSKLEDTGKAAKQPKG